MLAIFMDAVSITGSSVPYWFNISDERSSSVHARAGRNSLRSHRSSSSTGGTGGTIQMKDLQEKLEEALRSNKCESETEAKEQANANLTTLGEPTSLDGLSKRRPRFQKLLYPFIGPQMS